jgi:hypothetical protein
MPSTNDDSTSNDGTNNNNNNHVNDIAAATIPRRRVVRAKRPVRTAASMRRPDEDAPQREIMIASDGSAVAAAAPPTLADSNGAVAERKQQQQQEQQSSFAPMAVGSAAAVDMNDDDEDGEEEDDEDYDNNLFVSEGAQGVFHAFMMHRMEAEMSGATDEGIVESNHCDCPRCTAQRMMMQAEEEEEQNSCDCTECRAERDKDDDNSVSSADSMPPLEDRDGHFVVTEPKSKSDNDVFSETTAEDDGPHCAICFTPFSSRNPKVFLPCCGKAEGECESSMIFCEKCIFKTILIKDTEEMENQYGPFAAFMMSKRPSESKLGECPRCRRLISVQNSPFSVSVGTFEEAMRFAWERGDKSMRKLLFVLAFAHYHYTPFQLLGKDVTPLNRLCQLGVITAVTSGKLYKIDPFDQPKLYKYMTSYAIRPDFEDSDGKTITDDEEWLLTAYTVIIMEYLHAAHTSLTSWQFRVALRLGHNAAIVNWKYFNILPKETAHQLGSVISWAIVLFNIIIASLLVTVAVVAVAVAALSFGLAKSFKWTILTSQKPDSRGTLGKMALALVLCLACKCRLGWGFWRFVGVSMIFLAMAAENRPVPDVEH